MAVQVSRLREILREMHQLLVKHDEWHQETIEDVIAAVETGDSDKVAAALNWGGIWGGMGSVMDLVLTKMPWTAEFKTDIVDDTRLTELEIALLDEMARLHIVDPRRSGLRESLEMQLRSAQSKPNK